jgi:hypothetical protein
MTEQPYSDGSTPRSTAVASMILDNANRDIAFIVRISGESLDLLARHFQSFIENELKKNGVFYGDHPLLRLFVETHSRELTEFVVNGIALSHQLGLQAFERMGGDSMRLLRADLWDTLRSYIETAEQHFMSGLGGLQDILTEVQEMRAGKTGRADV